jgi:hypothetical protein
MLNFVNRIEYIYNCYYLLLSLFKLQLFCIIIIIINLITSIMSLVYIITNLIVNIILS